MLNSGKAKKTNELERFFKNENVPDPADAEGFEEWASDHFQQIREQAKLKRQQEKQEQAAAMAEQSVKSVYLKIAAAIHPDREVNDVKKSRKLNYCNVPMRPMQNRICLPY